MLQVNASPQDPNIVDNPPPSPATPIQLVEISVQKSSSSNKSLQRRFTEKWIDPKSDPKLPGLMLANNLEKHIEGRTNSQHSIIHTNNSTEKLEVSPKRRENLQKSKDTSLRYKKDEKGSQDQNGKEQMIVKEGLNPVGPKIELSQENIQRFQNSRLKDFKLIQHYDNPDENSPQKQSEKESRNGRSSDYGLVSQLRVSENSQIIIRDEFGINSRISEEKSEPSSIRKSDENRAEMYEFSTKIFEQEINRLVKPSISEEEDIQEGSNKGSNECVDFNSPKGEALASPRSYEKDESQPNTQEIQAYKIPELAENRTHDHQSQPSSNIDFTKLTNEDKSCAIADFILENLIMEAFTDDNRVKDKLMEKSKRITNYRSQRMTASISRYLTNIFEFINNSHEEQYQIYTKLNSPIQQTDLNRLLMASPQVFETDHVFASSLEYEAILNIQLYIRLEEELRDGEYIERGMSPVEIEREHIFHKLIFDCLNENLDYCRLYGFGGCAPSFFSEFREQKDISPGQCARVLEESKKKVVEWSLEKAGLLVEPSRSPIEDHLELLESAREDALTRHLRSYVTELESKWYINHDEILEVFLGTADQVFEELIQEVISDLNVIQSKRSGLPIPLRSRQLPKIIANYQIDI